MESGTPGGEGTPSEDVGSGDDDVRPSGAPDEAKTEGGTSASAEAPAGGSASAEAEAPAEPTGDAATGIDNGPPEPGEEPSEGVGADEEPSDDDE